MNYEEIRMLKLQVSAQRKIIEDMGRAAEKLVKMLLISWAFLAWAILMWQMK